MNTEFIKYLESLGFEHISTGCGFTAYCMTCGERRIMLSDVDDMTKKIGPDEHMGLGFYTNDGEQLAFVEGAWADLVGYVDDFIYLNAYPDEKLEGEE